jgi:hypothetical protein
MSVRFRPAPIETRRVIAHRNGESIASIARREGVRYQSVRNSIHNGEVRRRALLADAQNSLRIAHALMLGAHRPCSCPGCLP